MVKLNACVRRAPSHEKTLAEDISFNQLDDHERKVAKLALKAVATGIVLNVEYDGLSRLCEVHAVGISTGGKPVMRVYQLEAGQSHSGNPSPWRLMSLAKVRALPELVDIKSLAPRPGFNKGDAGMRHIFTEV